MAPPAARPRRPQQQARPKCHGDLRKSFTGKRFGALSSLPSRGSARKAHRHLGGLMPEVTEKARRGRSAAKPAKAAKRLLVTSPKGGVGKSTTSRNAAVAAAAEGGLKVALLDLDPQRG